LTAAPLELADIVRDYTPAFLQAYGHTTSPEQRRVLQDLVRCRTAELGGHVEQCDGCGQRRVAYNSCRNRHCPKCQAAARAEWLDERAAELLPVEYYVPENAMLSLLRFPSLGRRFFSERQHIVAR